MSEPTYSEIPDLLDIVIRALAALSVSPANRRFILDAGGLEFVVELLCNQQSRSALQVPLLSQALTKQFFQRILSVSISCICLSSRLPAPSCLHSSTILNSTLVK